MEYNKSTWYLYGILPDELLAMPYKVALQFKLDCGKELFKLLYNTDGEKDKDRLFHVQKAINHTRMLLDELQYYDEI